MKVRLLVELDYNNEIMHDGDAESIEWFYKQVLGASPNDNQNLLTLWSNLIGDEIGVIEVLEIIKDKNANN